MKNRDVSLIAVFSVLLLASLVTYVATSEPAPPPPTSQERGAPATAQAPVDLSPLETARKLSSLAGAPDEQTFARQALRLADQEVDLAFSSALRSAAEHPTTPSEETRELQARLKEVQERVKEEQQHVAQLSEQAAHARARDKDAVQQGIELAQAQLKLDQDELADAQQDLARSGGDAKANIQRMLGEHEAAEHQGGAPAGSAQNNPETQITFSLLSRLRAWRELHSKSVLLLAAQDEAREAAKLFVAKHEALESEVRQESAEKAELAKKATTLLHSEGKQSADSQQATAAALAAVKHLTEDQQTLAEFDKRIEAEQELAAVYGNWSALVRQRERAVLHKILESVTWLLTIGLLVVVLLAVIDRSFRRMARERKRLLTLRAVLRFAVRALGVALVLLVILGPPNQFATVVALAGAGLTVALKDFIVGFFGWFVLMGRNGIRVGDWVEINGVSGEVVEIGLFHTVLLETGSWSDASHPTGRKVTLANSFATEGHYFNFSTSGQWLWDDLEVALPLGEPPYETAEAIRQIVAKETEANARLAEQEWQRLASDTGIAGKFSATPAVALKPTGSGVNVTVRYLTRANERGEVRSRLYRAVVDLLHVKRVPGAAHRVKAVEAEEGQPSKPQS